MRAGGMTSIACRQADLGGFACWPDGMPTVALLSEGISVECRLGLCRSGGGLRQRERLGSAEVVADIGRGSDVASAEVVADFGRGTWPLPKWWRTSAEGATWLAACTTVPGCGRTFAPPCLVEQGISVDNNGMPTWPLPKWWRTSAEGAIGLCRSGGGLRQRERLGLRQCGGGLWQRRTFALA